MKINDFSKIFLFSSQHHLLIQLRSVLWWIFFQLNSSFILLLLTKKVKKLLQHKFSKCLESSWKLQNMSMTRKHIKYFDFTKTFILIYSTFLTHFESLWKVSNSGRNGSKHKTWIIPRSQISRNKCCSISQEMLWSLSVKLRVQLKLT